MTMRAIYWNGTGIPDPGTAVVPACRTGEVQIRVERAGISDIELSIFAGSHPRAHAPLIPGLEFVGSVSVRASDAAHIATGDRVAVDPFLSCGTCDACQRGFGASCSRRRIYGVDLSGGFAEYVNVAANRVYPLPDTLPAEIAVLAGPMALAVHAAKRARLRTADSVVVIGSGATGILIALLAQATGCKQVIVSEPVAERRVLAARGGLQAVDPKVEDVVAMVRQITGGSGADTVFETTGTASAVSSVSRMLRPRGTVVQISPTAQHLSRGLSDLTDTELTVIGAWSYESSDFEEAITFLDREQKLFRGFVFRVYTPDEAVTALNAARATDSGLRVTFDFR